MGSEIERNKSEEDRKDKDDKEHEHDSEPSKKASNEVTIEDLKHAPFPHRLAKASKANLNVEIYDVFKQI